MKKFTRFVGLDVHADSISVAVADEGRARARSLGSIPNEESAVRKMLRKLGAKSKLTVAYEAGPTGYALYRQITASGVHCIVVAPTLIPVRTGDRIKTDRRDAEKIAQCHRAGELTAVWVPDAEHEAFRSLVRARECAKKDELRVRNRLTKFLLRLGVKPPTGVRRWTSKYMQWLRHLRFEHLSNQLVLVDHLHEVEHASERVARLGEAIVDGFARMDEGTKAVAQALQSMRGIAHLTAVTLVAEVGRFSRFDKPQELMAFSGLVPRERSTGTRSRRGAITKTGNARLRRVLVEAAWHSRHRPARSIQLKKRQEGLPESVKAVAWKAQHRLHSKYVRMVARGKLRQQAVVATAREMLGFIWAIAVETERAQAAR